LLKLTNLVKPIKLSRTSIKYILGTGVSAHAGEWKDDPQMHKGIPSELTAIPEPEVRKGEDADGSYSEIVVPDVFGPGSIMIFETDMQVSCRVV
jgi:glycogen debranching enzyme